MWFLAFDKNVLVHSNLVALIVVHIASRKWEEIVETDHFKLKTVYVTAFKLKVPAGVCAVLQP